MSVTYRVGTPSDEEPLLAIENEAFVYRNDKFGKREMKYMLTKAHAEVVIAENDTGIVGFAVLLFRTGSSVAHGWSMAVLPDYQHNGVTTGLFAWSEQHLREIGYKRVSFEVRSANAGAQRLYERLGYHEIEQMPDHFGPGHDGLRMVKDLCRD